MVLPVIIRSTEEALLSVSDSMRQASYGLGAGKLRTVFRIVLPVAMPGILAGVILAIGRIVGETAALMYTLGTSTNTPSSLMSSGRSLALHMYMLSSEGLHVNEAYATGVILIITVLMINTLSSLLSRKLGKELPSMGTFSVRHLDLFYGDFQALKNISIQLPERQITALIGPSGCGKSTFLKTLNRMNDLVPSCHIEGQVLLDEQDIYSSKFNLNQLRKRVGMVFQQPNPCHVYL